MLFKKASFKEAFLFRNLRYDYNYSNMKVALFGATGFVGSYILDSLIDKEFSPSILIREKSKDKLSIPKNTNIVSGDIDDLDAIKETMEKADAVIYNIGIIREFPKKRITFNRLHFKGLKNCVDIGKGRHRNIVGYYGEENSWKKMLVEVNPDIVFISAGFDAHERDPLSQMNMTSEGFADLTKIVQEIADQVCRGHIVSVLEGGYDLQGLSTSVVAHLRQLSNQAE